MPNPVTPWAYSAQLTSRTCFTVVVAPINPYVGLLLKRTMAPRTHHMLYKRDATSSGVSLHQRNMEADDAMRSLQSLPKESTVQHRPPVGTTYMYVFQWDDDKNKEC